MDVTQKVLNGLRGRLGIEVSHPSWAGSLRVVSASYNTVEYGWTKMPEEMRTVDRLTYCCEADWSGDPIFVFDDEVEVVGAPAYMVVEELLDLVHMINPDIIERLENGEDGEDGE